MARQDLYNYPDEYYYPEALKSGVLTVAEMRKEYSRLRKLANRRLAALGRSVYADSQSYLRNVGKFVPLSQITSEREMIYKLYDVKKFISARSGSVTGLRAIEKQALETARERGLTFLNKKNLRAFGEYMEEARIRGYAKLYGSERVAGLFATATQKGFNPVELYEDFQYWMENRAELEQTPKIKSAKKRTSSNYRQALENRDIKRR